jgi:glycosyltransferase involved in cell wall biosynthesis
LKPVTVDTRGGPPPGLLIVGNFKPDVGYAWNTIGEYFVALGRMAQEEGMQSLICFPVLNDLPERFSKAGIDSVAFDFWSCGIRTLYRFVKDRSIRCIYLTDRPVFSPKYLACRLAGAKRIVVHDRTSGERQVPGALKRLGKKIVNRTPFSADLVLAISNYVRSRLISVSCFPPERIVRIWNGVDVRKFFPGKDDYVRDTYRIPRDHKIVFAYSRANGYKGIEVLIRAAARLVTGGGRNDVTFLFCGDGPDLEAFRSLVREEGLEGRFLCPGKARFVDRILLGVDLVVVPSLWQEGFGLSVVEGMAAGRPVIASKVGGIVEIITDGCDGYLVPPGDPAMLADRIAHLLDDDGERQRIGVDARRTVEARFDIEEKKKELVEQFRAFLPELTGN